jgi:hypothetical protein
VQLVLDTDGDGRISEKEILSAAKDLLAKLRSSGSAGEWFSGLLLFLIEDHNPS